MDERKSKGKAHFHDLKTEAEKKLTLKRKRIIAVISFIIAVGLMLWLGYFVTKTLLISIQGDGGIKTAASNFQKLIASYGNASVFVAFAIQFLQIIISPIPGEVIEVGMGVCFGWFWGMVICLAGGALAAAVIMMFVKKWGIRVVELFVSAEKINELKFINSEKKLERMVFLLYLIPGTPKDPLIFFFGLTKIKTRDFVVIQTIARIPTIVSSTIAGQFAVEENFLVTLVIFVVTGLMALGGMWFYHKILIRRENKKAQKEQKQISKDQDI